jgi:hypothetical protein
MDLITDKPKTTEMKKPIREYLAELPTPYNTLALSVVDENYEAYQAEVENLHQALSRMCNWEKTPQGRKFWIAVDNWFLDSKNTKLPPIPAVEVSPEVETPNKVNELFAAIEQVGKQVKKLEQENTELKAKLAELLNNPKELVYDAEWLANVVKKYGNYWMSTVSFRVGTTDYLGNEFPPLSPKDSAPIIMASLAKELNPLFEADCKYSWEVMFKNGEYSLLNNSIHSSIFGSVFTSEQAAQQAINILTQIAPEVLQNYFA